MNYLKAYCNLIRKAENRTPPEGYTEKHHIFPKSIFGNNNRVVVLTAREHYITHALLEKIYIKRYGLKDKRSIKMIYAHTVMKGNSGYVNSYLYESSRKRRSEVMKGKRPYEMTNETRQRMRDAAEGKIISSETRRKMSEAHIGKKYPPRSEEWKKKHSDRMKTNVGEKNSFYGKKHTEETKNSIRKTKIGKSLPEETKKKMKESWGKRLKLRHYITPQGELITIKNLREYCEENNLNHVCMINLHNGYGNSYKGYQKAQTQPPPRRDPNKPFEFE